MTNRKHLGKTKNGFAVYVDICSSHAATHFSDALNLFDLVVKAIPQIEVHADKVRTEFDFQKEVGLTDLTETNVNDEIVYALRPHRTRYTRFVKNKEQIPTSWITLDLRKVNEHEYDLQTAFVGRLTPSFPGGEYLPEQSREFWSKHALIWGKQEVDPDTVTSQCPW